MLLLIGFMMIFPVVGRCLVCTNTAKDCGILSGQCLCVRQQVLLHHFLFLEFLFFTAFHFLLLCFSSPTPCALKIAEKIFEQCNNAVLLMVISFRNLLMENVTLLQNLLGNPFFNWNNVCFRLMEKRCFQAAVFLLL